MENETEPRLDPRPLLLKRMVWDVFPHDFDLVKGVQGRLGLVPDHDEGAEVEHGASDKRVNRVAPLYKALETLSGYAAEVIGQYALAGIEAEAGSEVEIPEGFLETFAEQNTDVIYNGVYAVLCHLMDTGVLEYGAKVRG